MGPYRVNVLGVAWKVRILRDDKVFFLLRGVGGDLSHQVLILDWSIDCATKLAGLDLILDQQRFAWHDRHAVAVHEGDEREDEAEQPVRPPIKEWRVAVDANLV